MHVFGVHMYPVNLSYFNHKAVDFIINMNNSKSNDCNNSRDADFTCERCKDNNDNGNGGNDDDRSRGEYGDGEWHSHYCGF